MERHHASSIDKHVVCFPHQPPSMNTRVLGNSGNCLTFAVSDLLSSYTRWFPQASTSLHPGWEFQCVCSSWGVSACPLEPSASHS